MENVNGKIYFPEVCSAHHVDHTSVLAGECFCKIHRCEQYKKI